MSNLTQQFNDMDETHLAMSNPVDLAKYIVELRGEMETIREDIREEYNEEFIHPDDVSDYIENDGNTIIDNDELEELNETITEQEVKIEKLEERLTESHSLIGKEFIEGTEKYNELKEEIEKLKETNKQLRVSLMAEDDAVWKKWLGDTDNPITLLKKYNEDCKELRSFQKEVDQMEAELGEIHEDYEDMRFHDLPKVITDLREENMKKKTIIEELELKLQFECGDEFDMESFNEYLKRVCDDEEYKKWYDYCEFADYDIEFIS